MPDITTATEENEQVSQPIENPFSTESWTDTPPTTTVEIKDEEKKEEPKTSDEPIVEKKEEPVIEAKKDEPVVEVKKEDQKVEIKRNPLVERLLADGVSDDVVFDFLQTKKELSAIESLSPADILRLQIKHANKDYNAQDIADVFDEKYSLPEKPVQDDLEDDDVFQNRLSKWEDAKAKVDRRIERDARTAKADLAKIKDELVYPTIPKTEESSQKELDAGKVTEIRNNYLKTLETEHKNFKGFDTKVVYKSGEAEVEIPISYGLSEADQASLKNDLQDFDSDTYFYDRWFDKDGKPKVVQSMRDKYLLENFDKILAKVANDAAGKRLDAFINVQKNIKVNGGGSGIVSTSTAKDEVVAMSDFFFSQ